MKLEEAKKLVKSLLEGVGVSVIYYVDDYQSFDGLEDISKYIEDKTPEELQLHSDKLPEAILVAKEAGVEMSEVIQSWWDSLSNEKRDKFIKEFVPAKDLHAERDIRKLLGDKCLFCSPDQWDNEYSSACLDRIKKGEKVLLLFDQKIGKGQTAEGQGRTGLSMAQSFSSNDGVKENTYCGIFSQSFEREGEFEFRNKNREELASWAFPLSKKRMPKDNDYTLFIEGINNILWVGYADNLSSMATNLIDETSKKIKEEFGKIMPLEFKQVVIDSSYEEGCREIDTLLRLIHIIFEREIQTALAGSEGRLKAFGDNVKGIKDIDSIVSKKLQKDIQGNRYDAKAVNKFFLDETFIPGSVINQLLMPLQNGDVFCVNNEKFYVLLCQPCTISLRSGGKRGGNGIGYFVPLEESTAESSIEKDIDKLLSKTGDEIEKAKTKLKENIHEKLLAAAQGYSYKVKCPINEKYLCALINKYTPISLSLLDFCTFSEDGQVIINKECSANLHQNQRLLNERHIKNFKESLNLEHLVEGLDADCHAIVKRKVESWFYTFLTRIGIKSEFDNSRYVFPIIRYGHIQDPLASDLLTQLSHYMSRAGLPNEFESKK
ncbi:hypothetical protein [uncultured Prevotella sp.]|uniref:hypothetical protein n=1 Tax=uncultured Prevotella sp. TaxID=159272 RepID=UPI0025830644|nr:hypothetical protein [uncultured Prevotella sp.]